MLLDVYMFFLHVFLKAKNVLQLVCDEKLRQSDLNKSTSVQVMSVICTLSLRAPDHATRAIEAGAGDLAIRVMNKFPEVPQLQKHACLMIRNLVVRNPENRQGTSYVISQFVSCWVNGFHMGLITSIRSVTHFFHCTELFYLVLTLRRSYGQPREIIQAAKMLLRMLSGI